MMPLLWVMLWSMLPPLAHFSTPDRCGVHESSSSQNESPSLKSLQCYNDYNTSVHCEWSEDNNTMLQLWFKTKDDREQCVPYSAAAQTTSDPRTVQCRYKTDTFSIGIKHTVFFLKKEMEAQCLSLPHKPLNLSQHLRARPPVNLTTHDTGDGGRQLSWSSSYPSSSSLNKNITYQLSFRTHRQDNWRTEDVANTTLKLEKQLLLPGRRYEARVRARASVGQWSHWSPVVTWRTEEDAGQFPSLHCVLDEENKVTCSWEVSREVAHFITYQLACRHDQNAVSERCRVNQTVTSDLSRTLLKYSCSLNVPDPAHLLLELQPTRNAKILRASQHIRPNPPQDVKVREKGSNWIVEWTAPSTASKLSLFYELWYYRTNDQGCCFINVSVGSMSLTILGDSLVPTQHYQVRVRSLVVSGEDSSYRGIPSEWSDPVDWTSHEAAVPKTTLIYVSISVFVAAAFVTLYCTIPACQRRVILWVDSVPSPGKSKIMSEIKSATSQSLLQSANTSMCKVQHSDSLSTCFSDVSLWPTKDSENKLLESFEGCWKCDNLPFPAEEVNSCDTSSMSFSGPYIFCQAPDPDLKSADIRSEEKEETPLSDDSASPSPVNFSLYGEGYVCLPRRNVSRSTQDLVSHSDTNKITHEHGSTEQDQQHTEPSPSQPTSSHQPPAYTSGPLTFWPEGGAIQASGYCHLPQHKREQKSNVQVEEHVTDSHQILN